MTVHSTTAASRYHTSFLVLPYQVNCLSVLMYRTSSARVHRLSVHAIRILRTHGMSEQEIQTVFRSVVIAKLKYAATACWGFTAATDRQRVEAVICRDGRSKLCRSDIPTAAELVDDIDDNLFQRILWNEYHTLHALLPDRRPNLSYKLRPRSSGRKVAVELSCLTENNFLIRQLYKNCY